MGEIVEMMEEGILCQVCGVLMEDLIIPGEEPLQLRDGPGYFRSCEGCSDNEKPKKRKKRR